MLAFGSLAAGVGCSAAGDEASPEENVDEAQQEISFVQGRTATFLCHPPTGSVFQRNCSIQYGDGSRQDNILPGTFSHTYPSFGTYKYTMTLNWCTRSDCAYLSRASMTTADYMVLTPSGGWRIDLPSRFEGIAGQGLDMRAEGGPFTGANCCQVNWVFGDGDDDYLDNNAVTHQYNSPGNYTVSVALGDLYGNLLAHDSAPVTIYPGKANANCTVSNGNVTCTCKRGFRDTGTRCVDYDECAGENGGDNCGSNSRCDNTPGSFTCIACGSGYRVNAARTACRDIDECAENTDGCSSSRRCDNTSGGFACVLCPEGHRADPAGTACVDIDECARNSDNCFSHQRCENRDGSFRCVFCGGGHEADSAGTGCVDIDECARGTHGCHAAATCTNTIGSRTCTCPATLPVGNGIVCFPSQQAYDAYLNAVTICTNAQQGCYNSCPPIAGANCDSSCSPVFAQCMAHFGYP